ncbi:acyltransferase domain-containing protein [Streptomyces sp. NBC_01618]|uniref:acyltransferase domain-containing protein n=1 Tax=Streptomyces sp. NBC_01618 TaxID=2975900 RepID=UPI00386D69E4|nr:acyltransferase domain-containing protein [Streptomyces sp. NBC_01618]
MRTKALRVSHAFHSPLMDPMLEEFCQAIAGIEFAVLQFGFVSALTGSLVTDEVCSPEYWVRHVREAVRFADAVRVLDAEGVTSYLELGPDGVLSAMVRECLAEESTAVAVPALRRDRPEAASAISAFAHMLAQNVVADREAFFAQAGAVRVDLPTYAFQHQPYWVSTAVGSVGDVTSAGVGGIDHPLLGAVESLQRGTPRRSTPIGDRPVNSVIQPAGRPTTRLSDQGCCDDWLNPPSTRAPRSRTPAAGRASSRA